MTDFRIYNSHGYEIVLEVTIQGTRQTDDRDPGAPDPVLVDQDFGIINEIRIVAGVRHEGRVAFYASGITPFRSVGESARRVYPVGQEPNYLTVEAMAMTVVWNRTRKRTR